MLDFTKELVNENGDKVQVRNEPHDVNGKLYYIAITMQPPKNLVIQLIDENGMVPFYKDLKNMTDVTYEQVVFNKE